MKSGKLIKHCERFILFGIFWALYVFYSDSMEQFLNGSIEHLDFSSNVNLSTRHINQFIEENTNNQINDFVKPNMIKDAETVIVDAVYFKGIWVCDAKNNANC